MKKLNLALVILLIVLVISGVFLGYRYKHYKVAENFQSLPLSFDPYNSTSQYDWQGARVTIKGGFVKGKIIDGKNEELLLRSISPNPTVTIKGHGQGTKKYTIRLENVSPIKTKINNGSITYKIIDPHTISVQQTIADSAEKTIELAPKDAKDYLEFVILGDNRNGYQTFANIIDQINVINPVFTIDNGDLVFGGEANRYRLFNQTAAKLQVPLYTTIGNHDVREGGRPVYTKLYGPAYYSFDYKETHFVFLDSSRGWTEKTTIPKEQYQWLEKDLQNAQGKRIFVISHIPPTDPRTGVDPNKYPDIPGAKETSWFEREMNNYYLWKNIDHAFPDKKEAKKFEDLMAQYKVDTVFLSHIHSYYSFVKQDVRYIISGGGGAELLTKDSYYHFIRVKVTDKQNYLEVVQLPSPANTFQDRYLAAFQLFATSVYKEDTTYVLIVAGILAIILIWIIWITRHKLWPKLRFVGTWFYETGKFARTKYKELKSKK